MNFKQIGRSPLLTLCFVVAVSTLIEISGCGKQQTPTSNALPEINDENCRTERVAALPPDIRTTFGSICARRTTPTHSDAKSYSFK